MYVAGFATEQEVYDKGVREVFSGLDRVEEILSRQRYLTGAELTEADVRLYTTLVRYAMSCAHTHTHNNFPDILSNAWA